MIVVFNFIFTLIRLYIHKLLSIFDDLKDERYRYVCKYRCDGKTFYIVFPKPMSLDKRASPDLVEDENDNDVTDYIVSCMGINNDFHGIETTPKLLGHCKLKFSFGKSVYTFTRNQKIEFV